MSTLFAFLALLFTFFLGWALGAVVAYKSFRKSFKAGVQETLAEMNPKTRALISEAILELKVCTDSSACEICGGKSWQGTCCIMCGTDKTAIDP